jgi:hypothetical protein
MKRLIRPLGLVIVAAVVGYLLARSAGGPGGSSPDALTHTARAAEFTIHYPSAWQTSSPPSVPGLTLGRPVAIGPSSASGIGERFALGTIRAATVGTLPAAFLRSLPDRPQAQTVALGRFRYDRYLNLRPHGVSGVVSVYLLATTRSTIVATCASPRPDGSFTAQCERVLRTIRLPAGVAVTSGVDAAYALELNGILAVLNRARSAAAPALLSHSLATRARAARRLAGAEAKAATAAGRLSAASAARANHVLVAALKQAAGGYRALATAADTHDQTAYGSARRTLASAQQRLTLAFKALSRLGYRLR